MRFGIEEEFFLLNIENKGFSQQQELLMVLIKKHNFRVVEECDDNMPIKVNKDLKDGYISIKFDSTYEILEIAFPPFHSLTEFSDVAFLMHEQINKISKGLGLSIYRKGFRESNLDEKYFLKKDSVYKTLNRKAANNKYYDRFYHGKICSTQIHLDINKKDFFKLNKLFYLFEPLLVFLYSNSSKNDYYNYRLKLLQHSFSSNYLLFGYPLFIPSNEQEYSKTIELSKGFWRDYSLIVPITDNRWEFRSTCVQENTDNLINLIKLRISLSEFILELSPEIDIEKLSLSRKAYMEMLKNPNNKLFIRYINFMKNDYSLDSILSSEELKRINCVS